MSFKDFLENFSEIKTQKGNIPVWWVYTAGLAGEIFYEGLKEGKIKGGVCKGCKSIIIPPRIYCEDCFEKIEKFIDVEGPFLVLSFTEIYFDLDGKPLERPYKVGFMVMPNSKGGIIHFLDPEVEICCGDYVKPIFSEKRVGSIKDIKYFTKYKDK
ncbi:MAG: zinc ribbon domain-containing protein [Candidatus Hydrothermales bacterium]